MTADAALTFTLTVSDAGGRTATDSVTVTVQNVRPATNTVRTPASGETLAPATAANTASSWKTAEYTRSNGLGLIRAAEGYAARTTGEPGGGGVTVAVFGVKIPPHPELAGIATYEVHGGNRDNHEVEVAGIVAARRNGSGGHGVAYNANLVGLSYDFTYDLEAAFASMAGLSGTYERGVSSVPAASAHIGVISRAYTYRRRHRYQDSIERGLRRLADRGRILFTGLANAGATGPGGLPATAAMEDGIAGHVIVVGSLNWNGDGKARHSNTCGFARRWCLFAPGEQVYTTSYGGQCPGSTCSYGHAVKDGTSFAAPYAAGAAAAVWAAFPNKTASQIVDRLLTTARQVDTATGAYDSTTGLSDTYGHGALDLGAAMNPVGFTSMMLPGSGAAPVRGTAVRLPPGASVRPVAALADTVVYDEQGFPFLHDLNAAFLAGEDPASASLLDGFLEPARREWTVAPLGVGAAFSFAGPAGRDRAAWRAFDTESDAGEPLRDYRFSLQPQAGLTVTVGQGAGAPGARTGFAASVDRGLFADGLSVRPFAAFSGEGPGVGVDWRLDGRTRLSFSGRDGQSRFGAPRARLVSVGVDRRFAGGLSVKLGAGTLRERGARLGMRSSGGFGPAPASVTNFVDLGVEKPLSGKATAFGSYSFGSTGARPGAPGSLVRRWGALRSDSLAVGVSAAGVFAPGDRLTATASAPFRPRGRVAMVLAPAREVADGEVAFAARAVSLASAGREVRTQLVYDAWSGDRASATLGGYARFGADAGAPAGGPDWGIAAKMRLGF